MFYLLGELTRLVRAVEDLVVEHGEVEGEPQPDGVRGLHLGLADLESVLVCFLRVVNDRYKTLVGIKTRWHTKNIFVRIGSKREGVILYFYVALPQIYNF